MFSKLAATSFRASGALNPTTTALLARSTAVQASKLIASLPPSVLSVNKPSLETRRTFITAMCKKIFGLPEADQNKNLTRTAAATSAATATAASILPGIALAETAPATPAATTATAAAPAQPLVDAATAAATTPSSAAEVVADVASAAAAVDAPTWFQRTFGFTQQAWEQPGAIVGGMIDLIDKFQTVTGLPWWAAIVTFSIGLRLITVPLMYKQTKGTAKLQEIQPELQRLRKEMDTPGLSQAERQEILLDIQALLARSGVSPIKSLLLGLSTIPIFIVMFLALRNMAMHPQFMEAFRTGGVGPWMDLTKVDSTYALAVTVGLSNLALLELNFRDQRNAAQPNPFASAMQKTFRVMTILFIPFIAQFPTALFCFWFPSNLVTITWTLLIRNNAVRRALGIPERVIRAATTVANNTVRAAQSGASPLPGVARQPVTMYKGRGMPKSFRKPTNANSTSSTTEQK